MNKMIIAVFNTEEKAYEGLASIKELHNNDDLTVYATAVIDKNENGEVKIKQLSDKGPIGTTVGAVCGALIGLVAGPAGVVVGASAGMFGGLYFDVDNANVNATFLEEVSEALSEGKTAVVADVSEHWVTPVDAKLEKLDAIVYRRIRSEVAEDQFNRELDELNNEFTELEQELEKSNDEMKENVHKKMDAAREKSAALKSLIDSKIISLKTETEAKTKVLDSEIKKANEKRKNKLEEQKVALKNNFKKQNDKLVAASLKFSEYLL